jgi:hypothetical protein
MKLLTGTSRAPRRSAEQEPDHSDRGNKAVGGATELLIPCPARAEMRRDIWMAAPGLALRGGLPLGYREKCLPSPASTNSIAHGSLESSALVQSRKLVKALDNRRHRVFTNASGSRVRICAADSPIVTTYRPVK